MFSRRWPQGAINSAVFRIAQPYPTSLPTSRVKNRLWARVPCRNWGLMDLIGRCPLWSSCRCVTQVAIDTVAIVGGWLQQGHDRRNEVMILHGNPLVSIRATIAIAIRIDIPSSRLRTVLPYGKLSTLFFIAGSRMTRAIKEFQYPVRYGQVIQLVFRALIERSL